MSLRKCPTKTKVKLFAIWQFCSVIINNLFDIILDVCDKLIYIWQYSVQKMSECPKETGIYATIG